MNIVDLSDFRALKRRKLWPKLVSLQFNDVNFGLPIPTNLLDEVKYFFIIYRTLIDLNLIQFSWNFGVQESIDRPAQLLQGCCVFPGRVKNRACVLEHINDACYLQNGDILIVKSINIAWSPYFPILSGLVTEIGGIISHGTKN